jgi:hypothetical protein
MIIATLAIATGLWVVAGEKQSPGETGQIGRSKYAEAEFQNQFLKARLYLPDAQRGYYRGTRFDWAGLISRVDYDHHSFFCEFKQEHDPFNHDDICGTAEEFDIDSPPPGFVEAKPGDPFMKIGVGVLERPDGGDYAFWKRYKIRTPGTWKIERSPDKVIFQQNLQGPNGWVYDYTKTLEAPAGSPILRITRRLKNTGSQTIKTDHYGHNFSRIDNLPAGTNYSLEFRFTPLLTADSRAQDCVAVKGQSLVFTTNPPPEVAIWVRLEGFQKPEDNEIRMVNHQTGAAMTITTDQPLVKLVFYSSGGVLCPEPFVRLVIPPGVTREWTTTYRFAAETR